MTATRQDIAREAFTWLGTPFHDCSGVKGVGCDCAHLLIRVAAATGFIADFDPAYKPQWFQHRDEPLFLQELQKCGAHRIEPEKIDVGDIVMYNFGRHAAHGAIVLDANSIIHAYKPVGFVTVGSRRELADRFDSAWSLFA